MTNKKSLKRALILNVLSTLLCVSMLLGTTFAWFTDTVESGVNQIVAGNLDVEVEFSKDGQTWTDLAGATALFQTDKWEPGTTDYVYFRVSNPGDLALKYQVAVYAASEVTSTSVAGDTIKLSDILNFGMTAASSDFTELADRAAARAAADETELTLGAFSAAKTLQPSATAYDYFSLVVYMPEEIGNEANYNKAAGYAAPSINLGVKLVATQVESESDSFDNTYDSGTTNNTELEPTVTTASVTAAADGSATLTVANAPAAAEASVGTTTAEFEADAFAEDDKVELTVSTSDLETTFTATSGDYVAAIDLSLLINGTKAETFNDKAVTITTYIAKGLTGVGVEYNGTGAQPNFVSYDPADGKLVFTTTHFSEYVVTSDSVAYVKESDTAYGTLQAAIDAAQDGDVIALLANIDLESSEKVTVNKTITLNMNEKTITGSAQELVQVGSSTTIGHLTIRGNGSISSSAGNMLTVNPNSTLDIYDGNYVGLTRTFNVSGGKVTTYGGSFSTTMENQDSLAYLESACYCNFLGGTFTTPTNGNYGICIKDASVVNLGAKGEAGPSFSTWRPCISTNGMWSHAATININSGTYKSNRTTGTPDDQSVIQLANDSSQTQTLNVYGGYFEQTSAPDGSVFHVRYHGTININISGGSFKHLGSSLFTGFGRDNNSGWPTVANIIVNVTNNAIAGKQTVLMYGSGGTRRQDLDFDVNP